MASSRVHRPAAKGCYSETGRLRKVVMCPPTFFEIVEPTNYMQWLYYSDGLPKPRAVVMAEQHLRLVQILREEDVEVDLISPDPRLPYQHATRDVGVVIGETIVLSSLKERTRRLEAQATEPVLQQYRLRILTPDQGFIEGGDVIVDGNRLWVGLGARTDERGAEFLYRTFKQDYDVIPLHFDPKHTHLDTVMGVLSRGHAILYEPAFDSISLRHIQQAYPNTILLTEQEQQNAGANVLSLRPDKVVSIAENHSVNERLTAAGFEVITLSYSEVIKSGGSVRCDTLPLERDA